MSLKTDAAGAAAAPATAGSEDRILELRSIVKTFGGVTALDDVSLHLRRQEVVAIVGDNGAGKSTLMKIIAGVHAPTEGEIVLGGETVEFHDPRASRAHGIEVVYQDLALAASQEVYMNMFLGRELRKGPLRLLDKKAMKAETQQILDELDIRIPSASALVEHLSGGQRQGIAIGRATHWATQFVLMDEPTAALGVQETGRVEDIIRRLRDRGRTVLMVSHNLDQVFRLADRIYVLRRGTMIGERRTSETTGDEIVSMITGLN
jgi:ABC-type sugar transport system ATPase subunit